MNKKITTLLFGLFVAFTSQAQNISSIEGQNLLFKRSEKSSEAISGSQYFKENFASAQVNDGTEYFSIRYNNHKDVMEYQKTSTEILDLIPEKNVKVKFADGTTYLLKNYKDARGDEKRGYLKLISSDNNVSFYVAEKVKYNPAVKARNSYETDKSAEFTKEKTLYFVEANGVLHNVSKAKDIQKVFAKHENQLKEFFKTNKIDFDKKDQVQTLVSFLAKL